MTMTGRERVIAALTFSSPDRAPRDLWVLPYSSMFRAEEVAAVLERYPLDFERVELYPEAVADQENQLAKPGTYTDDWGSVWQIGVPGTIGEVRKPAVGDWSDLPSFRPPWHLIRGKNLDFFNRSCDLSTCFTLSGCCFAFCINPALPNSTSIRSVPNETNVRVVFISTVPGLACGAGTSSSIVLPFFKSCIICFIMYVLLLMEVYVTSSRYAMLSG